MQSLVLFAFGLRNLTNKFEPCLTGTVTSRPGLMILIEIKQYTGRVSNDMRL